MFYSVSLFFKGLHEDGTQKVWEERIILIDAEDESQVEKKAKSLANEYEVEYRTANGDLLKWVFVDIGSIFEIESSQIEGGVELFSRFIKESEAESLLAPFEDE